MVFFMPFHANFWPLFDLKIPVQPSEVMLSFFLIASYLNKREKINFDKYDLIAIVWVAFNVLTLFTVSFNKEILIEVAKPFILFLLYKAVREYMLKYGIKDTIIPFIFSIVFLSLLAIIGLFLDFLGLNNILILQAQDFPYLGSIGRARAFTSTPNMLGSFLLVSLLLTLYMIIDSNKNKSKYIYISIFILMVFAFIFAISKTIVLMIASIILFYSLYKKTLSRAIKYSLRVLSLSLFLFYLIASHIVIGFVNNKEMSKSQEEGYISEGVQFGGFYIAPTVYYLLKKGGIEVLRNDYLHGLGPGQYKKQYKTLRKKNIYNDTMGKYNPHFTFLKAIVELGIFSGFYMVLAFITIFKDFTKRSLSAVKNTDGFLGLILFSLIIGIFVESFVTDIMNFRQYWYLYAIVAWYLNVEKSNKNKCNPPKN